MRVGTKGTSWIKDDFYFPSLGLELPLFQCVFSQVRRSGSSQPDPNSTMDDLSDLASVATRTRAQMRAITAEGNSYLLDGHRDLTSPVSDISEFSDLGGTTNSSYFSDLGSGSTVDVRDLQEDLVRRTIVLSDGEIDWKRCINAMVYGNIKHCEYLSLLKRKCLI